MTFDTNLLLYINGLHRPWLDGLFWSITSDYFALAAFIITSIAVFYQYGVKTYLLFFVALLLCVALSDALASLLFKPWVERLRPSHTAELAAVLHLVNDYRGGLYSFYSSHASNSAALSFLALPLMTSNWLRLLLIAYFLLFGFSRIYLGVHYPSDVLVGWLVGALIGYLGYKLILQRRLTQAKITRPDED